MTQPCNRWLCVDKYRETFDLGAVVGTIDSFPDLGVVIEIEGSAEEIEIEKKVLEELNLTCEFSSITHGDIVENFQKITEKQPRKIFSENEKKNF